MSEQGLQLVSDELKTVPRGWSRDHPRLDLLRLRNLTLHRTYPPGAWLSTPECLARVEQTWRELDRWNDWLHRNVAPS